MLQFSPHKGLKVPICLACIASKAKRLTSKHENLSKVMKHLQMVLNTPDISSVVQTVPVKKYDLREQDCVPKSTITILYMEGVSKGIRRVCRRLGIRVTFRTVRTTGEMIQGSLSGPLHMWVGTAGMYRLKEKNTGMPAVTDT